MNAELPAESVAIVEGEFPHYFSTYCIHRLHEDCRLTCKHCKAECRCPCHWSNTAKYPEAEHNDGCDIPGCDHKRSNRDYDMRPIDGDGGVE